MMHGNIRKYYWLMLLISLMASCVFAGPRPLKGDEAFKFNVTVENPQLVSVHFQVADGYYLYRKHMHFTVTPVVETNVRLPQGETRQDLTHGEYEVYAGQFTIPIVLKSYQKTIDLKIAYQGCSSKGFCYPPMHKTVSLNMGSPSGFQGLLTDQNRIYHLFDSQSLPFMLIIFAGIGVLLALTPCVLPMIPILMSIIAGHHQLSTRKAFFLSVVYVLGSAFTYAGAGLLTAYMGASLQSHLQQPWVIALASSLFVLLSLSLFGVLDLRLPSYWQNRITAISRKQTGGTYVGVFIMGMISTLIVSPCVTAPLVGVLAYIGKTGNLLLGGSALFAMGIGMGIPLVIMAMSAGKWLPKRGVWMILVQYLFGAVMIGMAIWLLSRVLSVATFMIFAGVLLLSLSLFLRHRPWFNRGVGLAASISGVLLIVAVNVSSLSTHLPAHQSSADSLHSFTIVKNLDELNQQLSKAHESGKPVMLDFYADWCESCVAMDKKVFSQPHVMQSLASFVLLRADLTENNEADEVILKNYGVIAPPTVIFFNTNGDEVTSHRIVGELNADEFNQRIHSFITASCDKNATC